MLLAGCLSDADLSTGQPFCPAPGDDYEAFRPVNGVLEKRCGTLDCHGDSARPFQVFGQTAFRRLGDPDPPVDYYPGGAATTPFELEGTYQSVCGLEPEKTDAVVQKLEQPESLTFIRKPRLQEKHKGGRIWDAGSLFGDRCLVTWLLGALEADRCEAEIQEQL